MIEPLDTHPRRAKHLLCRLRQCEGLIDPATVLRLEGTTRYEFELMLALIRIEDEVQAEMKKKRREDLLNG